LKVKLEEILTNAEQAQIQKEKDYQEKIEAEVKKTKDEFEK